jgi:hypothetical protein
MMDLKSIISLCIEQGGAVDQCETRYLLRLIHVCGLSQWDSGGDWCL